VYLKSLTLKGFKSFADPTTLELRPGLTVVVGPNGSGKSNVVDAVAWVLGAQGPRVVRSAKMDDVIFAGTDKRPALGRAEVSLTIDNSSRKIPVDLNEITVTRTLFRTGESEYALNGATCRLLDVQELLSDTGVGRQQHVIIGQGQLDAILGARPEERRSVVEEAAGILKYRRRRERAERRLEGSEAGLVRLQDLLREVRRQIRPLERQAAAALRHEALAAELASLRLYLAGRELLGLDERLAADEKELERQSGELEVLACELSRLDVDLAAEQEVLDQDGIGELTLVLGRLERCGERASGLLALARERRQAKAALFAASLDASEVSGLEDELAAVRAELGECEAACAALAPEWEALVAAEADLAAKQEADAARFEASEPGSDGRLVRLRAEHARARDAFARAREHEIRSAERAEALKRRRQDLASGLASAEEASAPLGAAAALAAKAAAHANETLSECEQAASLAADARRLAEEALSGALARVEVLGLALGEARARAGLERLVGLRGVVGTLLDVVELDEELLLAFEAAIEPALGAVLVEGVDDAREALEHLRKAGAPGAVLPLLQPRWREVGSTHGDEPSGTVALRAKVRARDPAVEGLLDQLLDKVFLSLQGGAAAIDQALAAPDATIVTLQGDRFSPTGWRLGGGAAGATRAALEAAEARASSARTQLEAACAADEQARQHLEQARRAFAAASREQDRCDAELARNEEALAFAQRALEALVPEEEAAAQEVLAAREAVAAAREVLEGAVSSLEAAEAEEQVAASRRREAAVARDEREARSRALVALRRDLEVRAAALEERRSLLGGRIEELERRLASRRAAREQAAARREAYERDDLALERLIERLAQLEHRAKDAARRLGTERDRRVAANRARLERAAGLRRRRDEAERELARASERRQRLELAMTEARVRREAAVEALGRDLGATVESALGATVPEPADEAQVKARIREIEQELERIGPVNPLAAQELKELEERNGFLQSQLDDVQKARRELGRVIRAIDAEIAEMFAAAYEDVEHHFRALFETLFPGGTGRLHLSAPEDLLTTGIEIEARPAGRNVRRLSLLSGGERSLVAMAFLFAVFRSRPSPFYLMDEVEAALDEVNLRRFLGLLEQFRNEAQLIVVSHQKRTMEIADTLYGVSMQPGGASRVVSEQLRKTAEVL
jgi:chromosome segregation protein